MKIAYPVDLFDRNITDGRAMICSFLTLAIGNNQGMGDVEYAKMHDFWVPPAYLTAFDGPSTTISDLWRVLGRPHRDGGFIVGTIIKPKLGLRPQPFADACYDFWLGGDFIKNDEPQGNQIFSPMSDTIRRVRDAMKRAQDKTGQAKLFSSNITADDHYEMVARGEYHPGDLRRKRPPRRLPGRWLCHRPGRDHHRAPPLPRPVPALPPGRPRRRDLAAVDARLHRLRAVEDGADAGRLGHPHRHHELRQDGGRGIGQADGLHDHRRQCAMARISIRNGRG